MTVAVSELRAITTRSVALAAIVGLAVYGSVAIGGARNDLLRGIDRAIAQYHSTADIWVTYCRERLQHRWLHPPGDTPHGWLGPRA